MHNSGKRMEIRNENLGNSLLCSGAMYGNKKGRDNKKRINKA